MPRPRKPTNLHRASGTLRKGRHAGRLHEPVVAEPLGGPPTKAGFHNEENALWQEIAEMIPPGVATRSDRLLVEILVRLIAKARKSPQDLTPAMASQIRAGLASLGMTPADRSRVETALPESRNDIAGKYFPD